VKWLVRWGWLQADEIGDLHEVARAITEMIMDAIEREVVADPVRLGKIEPVERLSPRTEGAQ
jgi:hypothetical protein